MRFKRHIKFEQGLEQINIVATINVAFLLLIFIMLTSSLVIQPGINVNLPKVVTSSAVKPQNLEILVSGENILYLNGKEILTQELKEVLKQASLRNQSIVIKADRRAALGKVVGIWDLAREFGIAQVNIATNQQ